MILTSQQRPNNAVPSGKNR